MPLQIESRAEGSIGLAELLDHLNAEVDVADQEQLVGTAGMLKRLYNNRSFLGDYVTHELKNLASMQLENAYNSQVVLLGAGKDYVVRANFWPSAKDSILTAAGAETFYYDVPHDHNFNFLTIGYFGPGYESDFWEYDHGAVEGYVGEEVELRSLGRIGLPEGSLLFYRRSKDVHSQLYPKSFSVTLNIVHTDPGKLAGINQYHFDIPKRQVAAIINRNASPFIVNMARHLGGPETDGILYDLLDPKHSPRTRSEAYGALFERLPADRERLLSMSAADPSEYVRHVLHRELQRRIAA